MAYIGDGDKTLKFKKVFVTYVRKSREYTRKPITASVQYHVNELDKELENRELCFVRYADDCVITVGSEAVARIMYSISRYVEKRLSLKVNMAKTKIVRLSKLKYLGFGFWKLTKGCESLPHQDGVQSFKRKLKKLTDRKWSIDLNSRIEQLNLVIRGWIDYFSMTHMKSFIESIDERLRTRI